MCYDKEGTEPYVNQLPRRHCEHHQFGEATRCLRHRDRNDRGDEPFLRLHSIPSANPLAGEAQGWSNLLCSGLLDELSRYRLVQADDDRLVWP